MMPHSMLLSLPHDPFSSAYRCTPKHTGAGLAARPQSSSSCALRTIVADTIPGFNFGLVSLLVAT